MYSQAIWSGYQLTQEDFIELVSSLPSIRSHFENNFKREPTLVDCISAMMKWRRNLPQRYREKVPRMILRYHPGLKEREDLPLARVVSHVMLAYRYVPFRQRAQTTPAHPGYKSLSEPTEDERKLLDIFVRIVAAHGGTADAAKFEWSFMVEEHPSAGKPLL